MRFRMGMVIGFGAGYYLGAMAGRQRYEQINTLLGRVKQTDAFEQVTDRAKEATEVATEKAKAVVDLSVERAKDAVASDDPDAAAAPSTDPLAAHAPRN